MFNYQQPSAIDSAPVPEGKSKRESVLDVLQFLTHYFPTQQAWLLFSLDSNVTLDAANLFYAAGAAVSCSLWNMFYFLVAALVGRGPASSVVAGVIL